jgi:hypothetical protein
MNVKICLALEVLDLVQPWFQLSILKDRISGRGIGHGMREPAVVKAKSSVVCTCAHQ